MKPASDAEEVTEALVERALRLTEGFAQWPEAPMARMVKAARLGRYARGEVFHREDPDDPETLAVVSGYLMVTRALADGSRAKVGLVGPGTVVGISSGLVMEDDAIYEYLAHEDAIVVHLPTPQLFLLLDADPVLWKAMARMLLRQQREMLRTLLDRTLGQTRQRMAATIDRLASLHGVSQVEGTALRLRISQEDLAALLQMSRQTINKELRALGDAGVISPDYSAITVLDRQALRKLAGHAA